MSFLLFHFGSNANLSTMLLTLFCVLLPYEKARRNNPTLLNSGPVSKHNDMFFNQQFARGEYESIIENIT